MRSEVANISTDSLKMKTNVKDDACQECFYKKVALYVIKNLNTCLLGVKGDAF